MALAPAMTVNHLLAAHPFLAGFLAGYHPVFAGLESRIGKWGRVTTLGDLAVEMDMPWRLFLRDLQAEVARVTGVPPALAPEELAAAEEEAVGEKVRSLVQDLERGAPLADLTLEIQSATDGLDDAQVAALARRPPHGAAAGGVLDGSVAAARGLGPAHPVTALRRECERIAELATHLEEAAERLAEGTAPRQRASRDALLALLPRLDEMSVQRERLRRAWYPTLAVRGGRGPVTLVDGKLEDAMRLAQRLRAALGRPDVTTTIATARRCVSAVRMALAAEEDLLVPLALRALDRDDWEALGEQERVVGWALQGSAGRRRGT